ncbi:Aminomethyltransferase [Lutibaculum baratangense AMV1]|uniref:Aminomethyltransferase n=1 Tax=Lutibaculum baratangense AMV1 TaxID=631454 RepID=V4RK18_9HYPH|nr:Aminomethyltransferase [Lutibaculum baratangense AMV1]
MRPEFERPSALGAILTPGIPILPPGMERHPVPGGGSRTVRIEAGDEITVVDREGLQVCEIVLFTADGRAEPAMFGAPDAGVPTGLQAIFSSDEETAASLRRTLEREGLNLGTARCARVFGDASRPGDSESFVASAAGLLIVAAPGGPMAVDEQATPTEIVLYVRRANPAAGKRKVMPTAPLADPLADLNILPGFAKAYEVRAGQFIQILDVQGRECSDFQALDMRALEKGRISDIDPTTTRSLMGAAYPGPGTHSKYFSLEQKPLVEVVQDTVGRHDTFGLACYARYYEDMGYPGHVNCTDNINREMEAYGLAPRAGWPAANFFYNTAIDHENALIADEPWSRPGDYVLLRALTDLVCISTACPSDIDAANGWNPTDIQVRVYDEKESFKRAKGFRMTADADLKMTKETGFQGSFARHTRDFVEYNGYWLPRQITGLGAIEEYWACRRAAAVMDLSPLRKYEVTGPDAEKLLQLCVTRDMKKLSVGQVVYTAVTYEHGGMIDDGTVFRLGENNFRWIGGSDLSGIWMREQAEKLGLEAWVRSSTDQLHNIAVQGPKSRDILKEVIWTPPTQPSIEELGWFRFTVARIGAFDGISVVVSRTGFTGELGYEIFCHPRDAKAVFDAVWKAGEPHGMKPLGLDALNILRIEAGLVFAGLEFCDQTNPFEAGIGFTVPLKSKEDDFIGRAAIEERKAHPVRALVGLDLEGGLVPSHGDCVRVGRAQVGEITSAVRSPILGKAIALARLDVTHAAIGTELEVGQLDGQQKRIPAKVVRFPHFDPTKERVKGNYASA